MSGQALLDIVTETIIAFPEDAHIRVYQFLSNAGASDHEKKQVQLAWTRVSMAAEAFGKRSRTIEPKQFGKDFIKELSASTKDLSKLDNMISSFQTLILAREANERSAKKDSSSTRLTSLHDLKKSTGILSSLQSMTNVGKDLAKAQSAVYPARGSIGAAAMTGSIDVEESVLAHRRSCRTAKFLLNGKKPAHASLSYSPLSVRELDTAETVYGEAVYKHSVALSAGERSAKPTSVPIIGVKVTSKQPRTHSRAYCSYQCLHEVLPLGSDRLRLFPAPLGLLKMPEQAGPTTVFELPVCRPLLPMLGMTLSAFLRKLPSVALSWCAQIGATMRAFRSCASGRLLRDPCLNDVFVSENGQLLIGNVAFEEYSEGEETSTDLSNFFNLLLSSTLSLSRSMHLQLLPSLSGVDTPSTTSTRNQNDNETQPEDASAELGRRIDTAEEVLTLMEGCSLRLHFDTPSHGVRLLRVGESTTGVNRAHLQVHILGDDDVAYIEEVGKSDIMVSARGAGNLLLRVVTHAQDGGLRGGHGVKFFALDVRVVIVPAYPIQAPALQEVVAQLQASFVSNNNDMFLSSHAFCLLDPDTGISAPDKMMLYSEVDTHNDWVNILLQLDQHKSRNQ